MNIKGINDEDFINYKNPSMFIITSHCDFKCDKESGERCCQNSPLALLPIISVDDSTIIERYLNNSITKSIVFGGLEPMIQYDEIVCFLDSLRLRYQCQDDVVIYTGFNKDEVRDQIQLLSRFHNVVVKYGRFIPHRSKRFDTTLGVYLASDNQFAERIS